MSTQPAIVVTVPVKVILFGEHSVVFGAPAIAAAINHLTTAKIFENENNSLRFKFTKLDLDESFFLPALDVSIPDHLQSQQKQALECALGVYKSLPKPFSVGATIVVDSDFPLGAGLGSSASFSLALSAAIITHYARQINEDINMDSRGRFLITAELQNRIKVEADKCEMVFHGKSSGIDTSTCLLGGIIKFQKDEGATKVADELNMKVAVVDTKVQRQTSKVLQEVMHLRSRFPAATSSIYESMKEVAEAAISEIQEPSEPQNLLDLVRMNQGLLCALGVSHPVLDTIGLAVSGLGVGFKLTGAGVGGNALVFIPQTVSEDLVRDKLEEKGFIGDFVKVGVPGLRIFFDDNNHC